MSVILLVLAVVFFAAAYKFPGQTLLWVACPACFIGMFAIDIMLDRAIEFSQAPFMVLIVGSALGLVRYCITEKPFAAAQAA